MTHLIKVTMSEKHFQTFFNLQPDRPLYYNNLYQCALNIFYSLDLDDKVAELQRLVYEDIELPYDTTFDRFARAYYNLKFLHSKKAFCKVGDRIDFFKLTREEMGYKLDQIKNWIQYEVNMLARQVRFIAIDPIQL